MKIKSLFSSSSGNCTVVENETTRIMIDCGVSFKTLEGGWGESFNKLDALFVTHGHIDHVLGVGVIGRKIKTCTIYMPEGAFKEKEDLFFKTSPTFITGGDVIDVGDFKVNIFSTKHDSVGSVGYVVTEVTTNKTFGYMTDTGGITRTMRKALDNVDALFLEADYDVEGLEKNAEYDDFLKDRIRSPLGHLSNQDAVAYLKTLDLNKLQWCILGHLSKRTNSPEVLRGHLEQAFSGEINHKIHIACQPIILEVT